MPAINAFPQRPRRDPPFEDEVDTWAMPLGRIGGIKIQLSYAVFVAFAVLAGMIAVFKAPSGDPNLPSADSDLPLIALIGSGFWITGWFAQLATYVFFRSAAKIPIVSLTIGLLGIESRSRSWSAKSALLVTSTAVLSVLMLGGMLVVAEGLVMGGRSLQSALSVWTAPGFGLGSSDTVWLAGAWLLWIQAVCQMFPLPKSLGRVWLVSLVSVLARDVERPQTDTARRLLQVIATITAIIAVVSIESEPNLAIPRWPLLLLLAVILWITARGSDVDDMLIAFASTVEPGSEAALSRPARRTWLNRSGQSIRSVWLRRRARKALEQERNEAIDAGKLDDVLGQLHEQGFESLSSSDRALLNRVSEALRRQRDLESAPSESDHSGNQGDSA